MPIPLSLYIHIPWCVKKCPYCDFNSHALKDGLPQAEYVQALLADLRQDLPYIQGRPIKTIFFGGGTPSLLAPKYFAELLDSIAKIATLASDIEITMEANPGTIEHYNFADYKNAGINRISLGAQSFNNEKLKILGRIHKAEETLDAIEKIQQINFRSFNIDIMYGLPMQTIAECIQDLQTALNCKPPHLSWYQLTIEPNTVFHKYPPPLPVDDAAWEMHTQGIDLLKAHGFINYEVSAFAKPNMQCRHNINYWEFGDYLGIGAGAHGKITDLTTKQVRRMWKTRNPKDYLDVSQNFLAGTNIISAQDLPFEYMLNQLRLFSDVSLDKYQERTNLPVSSLLKPLNFAKSKGLLNYDTNHIYLTELGRRFLNDVIHIFLEQTEGR